MITDQQMIDANEWLAPYGAYVRVDGLILDSGYRRVDGRGRNRVQGQVNIMALRAILRSVRNYNQDPYRALPF